MNILKCNNIEYNVIKLLGKGKGGYSYLVTKNNNKYVLKQIHHEPCTYYTFGNKIEAENNDYIKLKNLITLPKLLDIDFTNERILKEYIDGPTIYDLVLNDLMKDTYYDQIEAMTKVLYENNLNIDYYPTNFVVENDKLYYIDYECNSYMDEWNYENWGVKYWSKTKDFLDTVKME